VSVDVVVHPIVVGVQRASHRPGELPASRAAAKHSIEPLHLIGEFTKPSIMYSLNDFHRY